MTGSPRLQISCDPTQSLLVLLSDTPRTGRLNESTAMTDDSCRRIVLRSQVSLCVRTPMWRRGVLRHDTNSGFDLGLTRVAGLGGGGARLDMAIK